jgi:hypothetical protein
VKGGVNMAEEIEQEATTFSDTKQVWTIIRDKDNVDLDIVKLEIFDIKTNQIILDMSWKAKLFFKTIVDLQYEYAK